MAQVVRMQVILNPEAATREQVMNTWHCHTVGATATSVAAADFAADLETFYTSIAGWLSHELDGLRPFVRCFDLSEPKPRQPVIEYTFVNALSAASSYAARELCVCLSYRAPYISGVSPKRKRGRIYLGPLGDGTIASTTGLIATAGRNGIATAADTLLTTSLASSTYHWCVYSPTTDVAGTGGAGSVSVLSGWVDDNPDIQRRRTVAGGTRTLFS